MMTDENIQQSHAKLAKEIAAGNRRAWVIVFVGCAVAIGAMMLVARVHF